MENGKIDYIKPVLNYPIYRYGTIFKDSHCISVSIETTYRNGKYSKAWHRQYGGAKELVQTIFLPVDSLYELAKQNLLCVDGINNSRADLVLTENGINIYSVSTFTIKRGGKLLEQDMYLAQSADKSLSYHADTAEKAKKGLAKKAKAINQKDKELSLTMDSYITANTYRKITGACKEGVNLFINQHALTETKKIKVSDLLKILTPKNYGYETFLKVIKQC